ncbi:MAG TPA: NADPH:quinone reductase [Spirochaetota bacterium]
MKAIVVREFGGPDVLKLEEISVPAPDAGQVLVRMKAIGVNPADTYARTGNYVIKLNIPFTPGTDGAGVIESVGAGITKVKPGDRVFVGRSVSGTYAEYTLAMESQVHPLPENVSFAQGAGVYVPYGTAYHALHHRAQARSSETVLVHGASGGVGIASVQMARAMGLTVFGTAGSAKGLELAKNEGAHEVFDHAKPDYQESILKATGGRGVDIIVEMLANVNLAADMKLIALKGRIVVIGSRGEITIAPRELMSRRGTIHAMMLWAITDGEASEIHSGLRAGLENETLRPVIGKEYPLSAAARAHTEVMEKGAYGKIILIP